MKDDNILRFFLIDFENVKKAGFEGLENCDEFDKIIIFYTDACDTINFDIHQKLMQTKALVEYQHVKAGGKNSLDHQLSSYIGYLVGNNLLCEFYIVSRDRGFEYVSDFWQNKNVIMDQVLNLNFDKFVAPEPPIFNIRIIDTVKKNPEESVESVESVKVNNLKIPSNDTVISALKDFPEYKDELLKIINENTSKAGVNHNLNKVVPPNKRGDVAKIIRPLIKHYST